MQKGVKQFRQRGAINSTLNRGSAETVSNPAVSAGIDIVVGLILDPAAEKLYQVTNSKMSFLQVLGGDTLEPIPGYKFFAANVDGEVLTPGTKVIVMLSESYPPLIIKTVSGEGTATEVFMELHSHQGFYDGGFLNHLGGGL